MLIEKQAIFDLMLDTRVWGQSYITNPFPYVKESITDFTSSDLNYYKGYFLEMTTKYSEIMKN